MLETYIADTQNLLNDSGSQFFRPETLTVYINRARRRIATASGCVRLMPHGAQTVPDQEEYRFRDWQALVQAEPGVREIFAVRSLAIAIGEAPGAWRPAWNRIPWTDFNARFRIWNRGWRGTISWPGYWSQYSFGTLGSIFLAPIPSQAQPIELDCSCMPFPLQRGDDPECIPMPWQDAVAYYSAWLCMLQQQRPADAQAMLQTFQAELPFAASVVNPAMVQSPYGSGVNRAI